VKAFVVGLGRLLAGAFARPGLSGPMERAYSSSGTPITLKPPST
jgi:hypothetical protein